MISRIRIEARAASMEEARREIEIVLGHAQMAAYMEGLTPQSSQITDDHFGAVYGHDQWHDYGMSYEGRMMLKFEPEPNPGGGLKMYGLKVTRDIGDERKAGHPFDPADDGRDVTATSIVLNRQQEVTRDHSWDRTPQREVRGLDFIDNGEAILADIKTIRDVKSVAARIEDGYVRVRVEMDGWESVTADGDTLAEAAYTARKAIIQMLDAAGPESNDPFEAMSRYDGVEYDIKPLGPSDSAKSGDKWRVNVSYGDGRCGFHSVGPTIEAAGRDALSSLKSALDPTGVAHS